LILESLLHELTRRGILIRLEGTGVRLKGKPAEITEPLLSVVRRYQGELADLLRVALALDRDHSAPGAVHITPGVVHMDSPPSGQCGLRVWTAPASLNPWQRDTTYPNPSNPIEISPHSPHPPTRDTPASRILTSPPGRETPLKAEEKRDGNYIPVQGTSLPPGCGLSGLSGLPVPKALDWETLKAQRWGPQLEREGPDIDIVIPNLARLMAALEARQCRPATASH
jgi:hypothetical protein